MRLLTEATRKIFTAGCFLLALSPRAEATDFSEIPPTAIAHESQQYSHVLPIIGSLGTGVEYRQHLSNTLAWRMSYYDLDESRSYARRSINYNLILKMFSHPAILDWHPFGGRFRASTGVVIGGARLTGTAHSSDITNYGQSITGSDVHRAASDIDPAQVISIGNTSIQGSDLIERAATLNPAQSLTMNGETIVGTDLGFVSVKVRYPEFAPYFGFGWGNIQGIKENWLYSIDIGVMYLGRPKVELSLSGAVAEVSEMYFPEETNALVSEEQRKIEDKLNGKRYFPVFTISLWYRF